MKRKKDLEQPNGAANGSRSMITGDLAESHSGRKTRILIVEDEPAMVAGPSPMSPILWCWT
jgi:hypothetical protein